MPISVAVPLLDYERSLLTSYEETFGSQQRLSGEEAQKNVAAVFSHWHWSMKIYQDYHALRWDHGWQACLENDRTATWEMYLRLLNRQLLHGTAPCYSRPTKILQRNPEFKDSFLLASDFDIGCPKPMRSPEDQTFWAKIVHMKHTYDTYPESENLLEIIPFEQITHIDPKPLGGGSRGFVYRGTWQQPRRIGMLEGEITRDVALKLMKGDTALDRVTFLKELDILYSALKGQNVAAIEFYGITKTPSADCNTANSCLPPDSLILVTEFATEGPILRYLQDRFDGTQKDWSLIYRYVESIAAGLKDLHRLGIIHRDLHQDNLLVCTHHYVLDARWPTLDDVLIADLGEGINISQNDTPDFLYHGNSDFWAPEVRASHQYSMASDMYAFGHLIRLMIEKKLEVDKGRFDNAERMIPQILLQLALFCLGTDPKRRVTAEDFSIIVCDFIDDNLCSDESMEFVKVTKDMAPYREDVWNAADAYLQRLEEDPTNTAMLVASEGSISYEMPAGELAVDQYGIVL
ncbi:kinase-like protein [Polychaeton citri CBS 116435]|uniref:Kinase-like protein n=1 Tax=Polychaeton citri CBS 116435 TaxID=1314669 RepID=A0A9P4QDB3_9PEZI|nr:kinase-like protein [Polychaeton citri CBS 116435]